MVTARITALLALMLLYGFCGLPGRSAAGGDAGPSGAAPARSAPATTATAPAASAPATHLEGPGGFPPGLGTLARAGQRRYSHPDLGYSVRYRSKAGLRADVFVYDFGQRALLAKSPAAALKKHFRRVKGDVLEAWSVRKGYEAKVVSSGSARLGAAPRQLPAMRARFTLALEDTELASDLVLAVHAGRYIKVRCTYPAEVGERGAQAVQRFLDDLGRFVLCGPKPAPATRPRSRPASAPATRTRR
jgi:hypothetical protein